VREQTADQQVRQVLNRLAFGPRPGDYDKVRQMGVDAWIDLQLHPERIPDPAVPPLLAQFATYSVSSAELLRDYPRPGQLQAQRARARTAADSMALRQQGQKIQQLVSDAQAARVGQAVVSERQLQEVLVDFWLNHFSVYSAKGPQERYYLSSYERDVIRPHVFGKFRDLLEAVAKSPAMLFYLDNSQSRADTSRVTTAMAQRGGGRGGRGGRAAIMGRGGIMYGRGVAPPGGQPGGQPVRPAAGRGASGLNENYGRELLELHTMGVDGGYTQHDVTEAARALTGWTIDLQNGGGFIFRPQLHDAESKTVLGVNLRAGRGIEDGEQLLDIVAHHPSTAHFIALKLARRFVGDTPPASLVDRAAQTFQLTDGDLREVVKTIVTSPEFFASAAYHSKVKTPFEVVVSALRAVNAEPDVTPRTARLVAQLGEPVFGRLTPDGWPETGAQWINTGSILNRINFGTQLAAGRVPGAQPRNWPLAQGLNRAPRAQQVDAVITAFLGGEASPETRAILMEGNNPFLSTAKVDTGAARMAMGRAPPDSAMPPALQQLPPLQGLAQIVGLALGSPEFQRR
jgi:uncharacterized protein (DUF1800 family)